MTSHVYCFGLSYKSYIQKPVLYPHYVVNIVHYDFIRRTRQVLEVISPMHQLVMVAIYACVYTDTLR